jgi:hypothetical protein
MNDPKSKLPDFKELGSMAKKLFSDIKNSVCEIFEGYKERHPSTETDECEEPESCEIKKSKPAKPKAATAKTTKPKKATPKAKKTPKE